MPSKSTIPEYSLATQAKKGVLVADLSRYQQYSKHTVREPHRDDHFTMIVIRSGRIDLTVDFEPVKISRPAFFLISPEQIHQLNRMDNVKGWLVNIDSAALTNDLRIHISNYLHEPLRLDKDSPVTAHIFALLKSAAGLCATSTNSFVENAVVTTIQSVVSLALSLGESNGPAKQNVGRGAVIYRQFKALLEQHFKVWKQTSDYAAKIAIAAGHLNDTVKAISGASVSVQIQERNVLEAKRLLYNTDWTVSKIGFELGYEDPVYFGKLFKKHTRLTPQGFRTKFRE